MKLDYNKMPDCVAIVGSRSFAKHAAWPRRTFAMRRLEEYLDRFVSSLPRASIEIVSGGAIGVDKTAIVMAERYGNPWTVYHPNDETEARHYVEACFMRNRRIVEHVAAQKGVVVAFIDENSYDGTRNTMREAGKRQVPVITFAFDSDAFYQWADIPKEFQQ